MLTAVLCGMLRANALAQAARTPAPAWPPVSAPSSGPLPLPPPSSGPATSRAGSRAGGSLAAPAPTPGRDLDPGSILGPNAVPIDLGTALRLAGVQNPELLFVRQQVLEAVAVRQLAAARFLPTLNGGGNYDNHTGNLQQSSGNILAVNRASVYVGAGAFAIAAGTVNIPGIVLAGNIDEGVFRYLAARQVVRQREFGNAAATNQVLLQAALAYSELLRAEQRRAIAVQTRDQAAELARVTAEYARVGQGRPADANRAATYFARRRAEVRQAEGNILRASARLCRILNLDPSVRLTPTDVCAVPMSIVPDPIPLCELIAIALLRRPELGERRAVVREALLSLEGAKLLPFSPTVLLGFSAGAFGGGSNLVSPVFGAMGPRSDLDALAYWSLLNLGVGNAALIKVARANLNERQFLELAVLNQVRDEVAEAYARTHARFAQIGEEEQAVRSGIEGWRLDLERMIEAVPEAGIERNPRPIEVLNSLELLVRSKNEYLDAIIDYNEAHFELYVALGQPPAAALAHPIPPGAIPPGADAARGIRLPATAPPPAVAPPPPAGPGTPFAPAGAGPEPRRP